MLYHQYMKPNSEYFGIPEVTEKDNRYEFDEIPNTYAVITDPDSVWKYYHLKDGLLPDQGWKIHVTSLLEDAPEMLDKVARFCIDKRIEFKHLKDRESFIKVNSKNANRASSGKFLTVYPPNNEIFIELLEDISSITSEFEKGPYILSDKRWKDSNVFYRYGGFKIINNEHGEHCIRDDEGNLIRDERTPFYQVPDFVKDFDDYLNRINKPEQIENESKLDQYNIEAALSYSNAGGVYLATRKKDNLRVIIKEARPKAGLDGMGKDALQRQKMELGALKKLKDVSGVVNLIDYFQEWEHHFLVEEFIEGQDLRKWLAENFPFYKDSPELTQYPEKSKKILLQLFNLVEEMHKEGIAMGDLQPANVIITKDLTVRMIDFETSTDIYSEEKPLMFTMGFVSEEMKVSGARDWYGLKKLIEYMSLPILSSEDLDGHLQNNHLNWMEKNYGPSHFNFILDLQEKCDEKINNYQKYVPNITNTNSYAAEFNLTSIINKLTKGLKLNITEDDKFVNGDIRQFEMDGGKFNFLTGGSGAAFTLTKNNLKTEEVDSWIESFLVDHLPLNESKGLLTGKTGILALLYERGYIDVALNEVKFLKDNMSESNISLRSGLSGFGLFVISLYLETNDSEHLQLAKEIEELIEVNRVKDEALKVNDWMGVNIGLIDGLCGVSLFYSALYSVTRNKVYLKKAELLLKEDLEKTRKDEVTGVLQTLDNRNRLLPYLSGGSIGVAISIWFFNHVSGQELYENELNAIFELSKTRCTVSGGLFDGAGSFLLIPSMLKEGSKRRDAINKVLGLLNMFLIKRDDYYVYPGQFSYRLSDDIYTGSSGIILALMGVVKNNPLYWLPLVNSDAFLGRTKAKKLSITR